MQLCLLISLEFPYDINVSELWQFAEACVLVRYQSSSGLTSAGWLW